jgi:hypothetical protein
VQGACMVQTSARDASGRTTRQAFVPAAVDVRADKGWSFAKAVRGEAFETDDVPPASPQQVK